MIKKTLVLLIASLSLVFISTHIVLAIGVGEICSLSDPNRRCDTGYECLPSQSDPNTFLCQFSPVASTFGKIQPPAAIRSLLQGDPTGAAGISQFLSNLIVLIYSIAGIVLILMLLWGAFDWLISEGDKERLQSAQNKIIAAIVGIILFAVAFAIIQVLGKFTGFTFFVG